MKHLCLLTAASLFFCLVYRANPIQAQTDPRIWDLDWNQDGTMLALAHVDGVIEILDSEGQSLANLQVTTDQLISVAWSPAEPSVLAFGTLYGIIQIIAVEGSEYHTLLELPLPQDAAPEVIHVREVGWDADGSHLAVNGQTGGGASSVSSIRVWDVTDGTLISTYQDASTLTDIAWHPSDVDTMLIMGVENNVGAHITLWHPTANSVEWTMQEANSLPMSVAWGPDGLRFASERNHIDGVIIRIHNGSTGAALKRLDTGISSIGATIIWNPSVNLVALGYDPGLRLGVVELWDENGENTIETTQTPDLLTLMDWQPSGELTLGSSGGIVELNTGIFGIIPELNATSTPEMGSQGG